MDGDTLPGACPLTSFRKPVCGVLLQPQMVTLWMEGSRARGDASNEQRWTISSATCADLAFSKAGACALVGAVLRSTIHNGRKFVARYSYFG